ncbi:MAG: cell surface protein SprA [Fibrobacter sp.]|nr:cell surface protein SprA [Fibrobacter sp.]
MSRKLLVLLSLVVCLVNASDSTLIPSLDYLTKPPVSEPLKGMLPKGGIEQHPSWGYLNFPKRNIVNEHEVDFASREVRIKSNYVNALSQDTENLWTAYYQELTSYTFDMYDVGLQNLWLNSLIGQKDGGQDGAEGSLFDIAIPINMPAWMKDLGLDKPKLQLQGQMDIRLLGKGVYDDAPGSLQKSLFPSPSLHYEPSFLVKGKIGRHITVEVNNSESGLGVRNQLRVIYAEATPGEFEDFVLQRLELGSTSLSLRGTELTGYSENHQGLFGVKADLKFGDWDVTAIASQDAGSAESYTLRASDQESEMRILDKNFVGYRYYFLDHRWRDQAVSQAVARGAFGNLSPPTELKLFKRNPINNEKDVLKDMTAIYYDSDGKEYRNKRDLRLVEMRKGVEWDWDSRSGTVKILTGGKGVLIAASWVGDLSGRTSAVVRSGQNVILVQDDNNGSNLPGIGKLMLRNVYQVGINENNATGFVLRFKDQNLKSVSNALTMLGLVDSTSGAVRSNDPDIFPKINGKYTGEMWLPCLPESWYRNQNMSPVEASKRARQNCLEPLRNVDSSAVMAQIYENPVHNLNQFASRYFFETIGKKRQTTINVRDPGSSFSVSSGNCIDIAPDSEKLKIGSDVLKKDVDYSVNYELGSIELLSEKALNPNNEISVTYECEPLFEIDNKILLGARAEYPFRSLGDNSLLGITALYKNQSTSQQQPRYGGEPFSSVLLGANLRLQDTAQWMDKFINALPFINTDAKSSWEMEAELAASYHNANSSDRKAALLEDFESSSRSLSYPLYRTSWTHASPPGGTDDDLSTYIPELDHRYLGEFIWHSNQYERYRNVYTEVNNTDIDTREMPVLKFTLRPNDNLEGKSWGGVMRANSEYWSDLSGMNMRYIEVVARGNVGSIFVDLGALSEDVSINGYKPNGVLDSEARDGTSTAINDFGLDGVDGSTQTESRLDWDCRVPGCVSTEVFSSGANTDAARDNFIEQKDATDPTIHINGTEGNNGPDERPFDTEDLNGNWTLDTDIRFVRYRINLEDDDRTTYDELKNGWRRWRIPLDAFDTIVSSTGGSWKEILSDAGFTRLWYGSLKSGVSEGQAQIVDFKIVGNQWQENDISNQYGIITSGPGQIIEVDGSYVETDAPGQVIKADSNYLHVRVINNRDDSRTYFKSPNTVSERDSETSATLKEQSLVLDFGGLNPGQEVWATKIFEGEDIDLTMYKQILMEIHYMSAMDDSPIRFALQFGQGGLESSSHYYEWSFKPITLRCEAQEREQDCHERNWLDNAFDLPLADFVGLKADHSPLNPSAPRRPSGAKAVERDEWVRIVGNPTISRVNWVRFVIIADENTALNDIEGTFWLNDLRLSGISNDWGIAGRVRGQLNFADVMSISGEMYYQDGDFATLKSEEKSPKPTLAESNTQLVLNGNYSLMLNKFFKDDWGLRIPLSIGVSSNIRRPYLKPSSDQMLSRDGIKDILPDIFDGSINTYDAQSLAQQRSGAVPEARGYQSVVNSKNLSVGFSKEYKKSDNIVSEVLTQTLLERPAFNYRYAETETRSALRADSSYTYNTTLDYKLGTFEPFNFKIFNALKDKKWMPNQLGNASFEPWPQTFDFTLMDLTYSKNINQELDADFVEPQVPRILDYDVSLRHKVNMRWNIFPFLTASYSLGINRDMEAGGDRERFTKENFFSTKKGSLFANGVIFDHDHTDRDVYGSYDFDSVLAVVENYSLRRPKLTPSGDTIPMIPGDTSTYHAFYDTTY